MKRYILAIALITCSALQLGGCMNNTGSTRQMTHAQSTAPQTSNNQNNPSVEANKMISPAH